MKNDRCNENNFARNFQKLAMIAVRSWVCFSITKLKYCGFFFQYFSFLVVKGPHYGGSDGLISDVYFVLKSDIDNNIAERNKII